MKRSKQKGSPQLKPRGAGDSVSSSPILTPESSPGCYSLGDSPLCKSAPNLRSFMMPPQTQYSSDTHITNFRSLSPAALQQTSATPQTGLGILLKNKNDAIANPANVAQDRFQSSQDEIDERERQASALAAAGMVAENVGYSIHMSNGPTSPPNGQGLHPPPRLGSLAPPPNPDPVSTMDGIHWGAMDVVIALDDMEMDFAKLFAVAYSSLFLKR